MSYWWRIAHRGVNTLWVELIATPIPTILDTFDYGQSSTPSYPRMNSNVAGCSTAILTKCVPGSRLPLYA